MRKTIYRLKDGEWNILAKMLMVNFGLPKVTSSCAMYFYKEKDVFGVNFVNSRCFFDANYTNSSVSKIAPKDSYEKRYPMEIENRNIKSFLKFLTTIGLDNAFVGKETINMTFEPDLGSSIKIILGTPMGDLVIDRGVVLPDTYNKYLYEELSEKFIEDFFEKNTKREEIFDAIGLLHPSITRYCDTHGISLKPFGETTIQRIISAKSNDYGKYENIYSSLLGVNFHSGVCTENMSSYFKPLSIIIPSYKSETTILKTLLSIQSQEIHEEQKKLIDVIVIDDGNDANLFTLLKDEISRLTFSVRFIRLEQNSGLSNARNLGVQLSRYSRLIFLDSDIVLPSNYLMEHSICLQLFPNCLFLSMKKNLEIGNPTIANNNILLGVSVPDSYDDKRLFRGTDLDNKSDSVVESLSETDLYKNFGYGRTVSGYDLASVVIGHNMSMNKSMFKKVGGFQTEFKGWGMEDALFGAKFIAKGGFIVPLLRTGVYHINHDPRSGSENKRKKELENNIKIYKKIINQAYE
jgi:glycosyltransferase involved in cell wall biosynthesis